jgi:hypothetical protein
MFTLVTNHQPNWNYEIESTHRKVGQVGIYLIGVYFDIIHKLGRVHQDVNGLNRYPSSNKEDTIGVHWHDEVDLEVVLGCHASTYLCTFLGCFRTMGIPMMWTWSKRAMVHRTFMMMHLSLHIWKQVKFQLD